MSWKRVQISHPHISFSWEVHRLTCVRDFVSISLKKDSETKSFPSFVAGGNVSIMCKLSSLGVTINNCFCTLTALPCPSRMILPILSVLLISPFLQGLFLTLVLFSTQYSSCVIKASLYVDHTCSSSNSCQPASSPSSICERLSSTLVKCLIPLHPL